MTRGQRRWHRAIWPMLLAVLVLGTAMAVVMRPPPEPPPAASAKEGGR